jgi:BirA family biotin operon repressor/biotin-[acetyl-CoA-carboxylase] ligase
LKEHATDYRHGDVIVARIQTAGRGRRDRTWVSTDGNLHLSVKLERSDCTADAFELIMRTSLAALEALRKFGVEAVIKYPNDLVVGYDKIAGILIETTDDMVILGVGINVVFDQQLAYDFHPTSIYLQTGRTVDYRDVLQAFLEALNHRWRQARGRILTAYRKASIVIGQSIRIDGEDRLVHAIEDDGSLRLDHNTGPTVTPNEITLSSWYMKTQSS